MNEIDLAGIVGFLAGVSVGLTLAVAIIVIF